MQVFHRSTNTIAKVSIFGSVLIIGFAAWVGGGVVRSSYVTRQDQVLPQPVPFSH